MFSNFPRRAGIRSSRLTTALVALACVAWIAGCSSDGDDNNPGGPGGSSAAPDFSIPDVNDTSPRFNDMVSPRDYQGQVSAWYFATPLEATAVASLATSIRFSRNSPPNAAARGFRSPA